MNHFINTQELSRELLQTLIDRAFQWQTKTESERPLAGKFVPLVFLNPSLRTRVSFEIAVTELGGTPISLSPGADAWALEHREGVVMDADKPEHVKDAAEVLSGYGSAIGVRAFPGLKDAGEDAADPVIEAFRKYARVPVVNMESALWHPCQALADAMTVEQTYDAIEGVKVALMWSYHPKPLPTAVPNSFLLALSKLGADVTVCHPEGFDLPAPVVEAAKKNGPVRFTHDRDVAGAQVVYAKSWAAPLVYTNRDDEKKRRESLKDWIVSPELMAKTDDAVFMHCLPVRRNVEVADAVIDGSRSVVYTQAENRLYVQKAILEWMVS